MVVINVSIITFFFYLVFLPRLFWHLIGTTKLLQQELKGRYSFPGAFKPSWLDFYWHRQAREYINRKSFNTHGLKCNKTSNYGFTEYKITKIRELNLSDEPKKLLLFNFYLIKTTIININQKCLGK